MKNISANDMIPMDLFKGAYPLEVRLAYALDDLPNIFGKIYAKGAYLWLHRDLAKTVALAAHLCHQESGCSFILYDGLRTSEAQEKMAHSAIVKANPQWMQEPRLLSPPGAGAHPRGMAIDISLMDRGGRLVDMGTDFDHLSENPHQDFNAAHRGYTHLSHTHAKNRDILNKAMAEAASRLDLPLLALPQEWWDFRFPREIYEIYAPLSDADLPPEMRMVGPQIRGDFDAFYRPRVAAIMRELDGVI